MKPIIKLPYFLLLFTVILNAQNSADIDLVVGTGFVGFSQVQAVAVQSDGKIIAAGHFIFGANGSDWEGRMCRFNPDGSIDTTFSVIPLKSDGVISDIAIQSDGKILVGGNFSTMNNVFTGSFIRLNSDGSKDVTFSNSNIGSVRSIALQSDGKIVVCGNLGYSINGHTQRYVLRLKTDGSVDNTFDTGPIGFPSFSSAVYKVAIQPDGKILAGGYFATFNSIPQGMLIRFNTDGTKDTTFDIGTGATGSNSLLDIVVQPNGKILISGGFDQWNGYSGMLRRLNSDGTVDNSFNLGLTSLAVSKIALRTDGNMVVLGNFTVNGQTRSIVSINGDGSSNDTFEGRQPTESLSCLKLQSDGKILIGGYMIAFSGIPKNGLARLTTDGQLDTTFNLNTGLNEKVSSIAMQSDGKTLIGGDFSTFDGITQNKIIRINDDGSKDNSFTIGTGFNNSVKIITTQPDGKLLVGGKFTQYNSQPANYLIRLNSNGTKDTSFNIGIGFNEYVKTIALQTDGKILIGGNFTQFNGQQQNYCIRLNADGTKDTSFIIENAFDGRITDIELQSDGKIIAGGNYITFNGLTQKGIVRLNADGTKDTTFQIGVGFNSSSADVIHDIAIQADGKIYVATSTGWYNNNYVGTLTRINNDGTHDGSFSVTPRFSGTGFVKTIALQQNGKIIAGGSFYTMGSTYQNRIVRLNINGELDTYFDINGLCDSYAGGFSNGECNDIIIQPNGKIWVGGNFFHYKGVSSFSAIRLVGENILSAENHHLNNRVHFYPNPVKDVLLLNKSLKTIKVTDISGKTVAIYANTNQLDFSIYPNGLYFLTTQDENDFIETQKIIKL